MMMFRFILLCLLALSSSSLPLPSKALNHYIETLPSPKYALTNYVDASRDPIAVEVPVTGGASPPCKVQVYDKLMIRSGDTFTVSVPSACTSNQTGNDWEKVIVEMTGEVGGVQFDRMGIIWLNGVQMIHPTTPEPLHPTNITWAVRKDVTEYASVFSNSDSISGALTIPNYVTDVYTGILNISVSVLFYPGKNDVVFPKVTPMQNVTTLAGLNYFGNQSLTVPLKITTEKPGQVYIDLYSSNHNSDGEEFYYLGPDPFRQYVLSLDGKPIQSMMPYPVVYTGGINPLLWRPLTGILSFDIPAYRFDLTSFLPLINDGKEHNVSFTVLGNPAAGWWNLDPVLLEYPSRRSSTVGKMISQNYRAPVIRTIPVDGNTNLTVAKQSYDVESLVNGQLTFLRRDIEYKNYQQSVGERQVARGEITEVTYFSYGNLRPTKTVSRYRFFLNYSQTSTSISATFVSSRKKSLSGPTTRRMTWKNSYAGDAFYNMTTGGARTSKSKSEMTVSMPGSKTCFELKYISENGVKKKVKNVDRCKYRVGLYVCASSLCGWQNYLLGASESKSVS